MVAENKRNIDMFYFPFALLTTVIIVCMIFAIVEKQNVNNIDEFNQNLISISCTVYNETLIQNICQDGTYHPYYQVCYWHVISLNYTDLYNKMEYFTYIRDDASLLPNKYYYLMNL